MSARLIAWIRYAIKLEEKGIKFYGSCYKNAKNSYAAQLFRFLLLEEGRHKKILVQVMTAASKGDEKKLKKSISYFRKINARIPIFSKKDFQMVSREETGITGILNKAIEFEGKSIKLYSGLEKIEKNKDIKAFFRRLRDDEKRHGEIIRNFGFSLLGINGI